MESEAAEREAMRDGLFWLAQLRLPRGKSSPAGAAQSVRHSSRHGEGKGKAPSDRRKGKDTTEKRGNEQQWHGSPGIGTAYQFSLSLFLSLSLSFSFSCSALAANPIQVLCTRLQRLPPPPPTGYPPRHLRKPSVQAMQEPEQEEMGAFSVLRNDITTQP